MKRNKHHKRNLKLILRSAEKMVLHKILLPVIYAFYKKRAINNELILFADSKNTEIPSSMTAIYEEVKRKGYQTENWCVDFDNYSLKEKLLYLYCFMKRYSEAKCVIICDYFLPVSSCAKKQETKVVQVWHTSGMLKKFGYEVYDDLGAQPNIKVTKNIDLWTVSSAMCVPMVEQATHLYEGQVQPLGVPRTDIYFDKNYHNDCVIEFQRRYPELIEKKIILWAPTFRGNAKDAILVGLEEIKQLQNILGESYYILIKVHPHLETKYHVNNCDIPTEKLYPAIDLLITDYSTTIFDSYLLKKPFLIYAPDFDEYMRERDCYLDPIHDLPCKVTKTYKELETEIFMIFSNIAAYDDTYLNLHMEKCDGKCVNRILDYLQL